MSPRPATLLAGAFALLLAGPLALTACQSEGGPTSEDASNAPPVVQLKMVDYAFGTPASVPSEWVTFQMENVGEETHEFFLGRLPKGKTFEDLRSDFLQPQDSLEQLLVEGTIDSAMHAKAARQALPKWIGKMESVGGGGLIGTGRTADVTLNLQQGTYAMICFISSPNGRTHAVQGMARSIAVTEDSSGAEPPEVDATIRSTGREITVEEPSGPGERTFALRVEEPPESLDGPYDAAFLIPLGPEEDAENLRDYHEDLHSIDFMGGATAPAGRTAYVTVELKPGRYGWVLPHDNEEAVVKTFTVE